MKINGEIKIILEVMKKYGVIEIPSLGTSMFPLIQQEDVCSFKPCDPLQLKKGDIVLFFSDSGQLIAHRFHKIDNVNNQTRYVFKGDTNLGFDSSILKEQIIGKLFSIKRNGKTKNITSLRYQIWSYMILLFPIISYWLRVYLNKRDSTATI